MNPYKSPKTESPKCQGVDDEVRVAPVPLLIWSILTIVVSFIGTPADPFSVYIFLILGIIGFGCGSYLTKFQGGTVLELSLGSVILIVAAGLMLGAYGRHVLTLVGYVILCIWLGRHVYGRMQRGRLRLMLSFCGGYVLLQRNIEFLRSGVDE